MRELERNLGYTFQKTELLRQALVHPSTKDRQDNQRLEFLGDAVLEFCMSELLYRKYPDAREGDLTARRAALVCEKALSLLARELNLGCFLRLGLGEEQQSGREKPSILADAMEAVFAAVFLDGGMDAAQSVIQRLFQNEAEFAAAQGRDDKSLLQMYTQASAMDLPEYEIVAETGPDHHKHFVAQVCIQGRPAATGEGVSKKAAEQAAAKAALVVLEQADCNVAGCAEKGISKDVNT